MTTGRINQVESLCAHTSMSCSTKSKRQNILKLSWTILYLFADTSTHSYPAAVLKTTVLVDISAQADQPEPKPVPRFPIWIAATPMQYGFTAFENSPCHVKHCSCDPIGQQPQGDTCNVLFSFFVPWAAPCLYEPGWAKKKNITKKPAICFCFCLWNLHFEQNIKLKLL